MRRRVVLLGALALTVSACGGVSQSTPGRTAHQKLADGRTFTQAIASDPGSLDPQMTVLSVAIQTDRYLYDSLLNVDSTGKPVTGLAAKWHATTTKATFSLRRGITCADGSPLTATDVAANINFVGDPANKSPFAGVTIAPGTKATGDNASRTVTLTSGAPDAFLLRNAGRLPMVCAAGLRDRSLLAKGGAGTGMFTVTETVPNDHYTLTRRKDYTWGPGAWKTNQPGLPDKVVVRVVPNATTSANLLLSGGLNAAATVGPDKKRLAAQKLFHADYLAPMGELFFNEAPGRAVQDEGARRALVQALDLTQLGKVLTSGTGTPATGMVTAEPRACTGDTVKGNLPAHDLAAARTALDAAGWRVGPSGVRVKDGKRLALTMIYATQLGPTMAPTAELAQQTWKSIGVDVKLKGVDSSGLNQALFTTGAWDVSMAPFGFELPSQAVRFVSGKAPPQGTNFAHVENAGYDSQVRRAAGLVGDESCRAWVAAETSLIKRVDVVPYVHSVVPFFGTGARFEVSAGSITPSSIRMYG
ncbi:ABC transporter substrate-binding protein [Streptomyces sp. NPDC056669]|uniref:ABC transporter substrate-binding protein n=1 Tax=Streptomyces sp. NPDC056669 TaxID=3345903 RepID=UPI00369886A8